jgi:integrase
VSGLLGCRPLFVRVIETRIPVLRWGQVDLDAGRLQVIRRKGSDDRVQPLSGVELRALRKLRRDQPAGLRQVFVSERGAPFTTNGFFKMLSRAAASIGMADVHPHLLRHGTGFKLVNQGVDTRTLAAYLGHRNLANTSRYTRMDGGVCLRTKSSNSRAQAETGRSRSRTGR